MSRRNLLVAAVTFLVTAPVAARAQQTPVAGSPIASDSVPRVMLETVVVTGRRSSGIGANLMAREQIRYLTRENAKLRRELRQYDDRVAVLVARVDSVHRVGAALESDIGIIADATASTRARRLQLEARLREIEGADALVARKER